MGWGNGAAAAAGRHFNLDVEARVGTAETTTQGPPRQRGKLFGKVIDSDGFEVVTGGFRASFVNPYGLSLNLRASPHGHFFGHVPVQPAKVSQRQARQERVALRFWLYSATLGVSEEPVAVSFPLMAVPVDGFQTTGAVGG